MNLLTYRQVIAELDKRGFRLIRKIGPYLCRFTMPYDRDESGIFDARDLLRELTQGE